MEDKNRMLMERLNKQDEDYERRMITMLAKANSDFNGDENNVSLILLLDL